jgi:hypothetical protein
MKRSGSPYVYTIMTFGGSILPLIFSAAFIRVFGTANEWPKFSRVAGNGEISIICIPLAITVIYSLYTTKDKISFYRWSDIVFWVTGLFTVFGVLFYAGQMSNSASASNPALMVFSIYFGVWTIVATFSSKLIEDKRTNPIQERQAAMNSLDSKFESTNK